MSYPKQLYQHPGPYGLANRSYAVAGAADEDEEAALIERGWHPTKEAAWGIDPLDHDADGKKGGSLPAVNYPGAGYDLPALRKAYTEKMGKKPFGGWDAIELQARMAAARDD